MQIIADWLRQLLHLTADTQVKGVETLLLLFFLFLVNWAVQWLIGLRQERCVGAPSLAKRGEIYPSFFGLGVAYPSLAGRGGVVGDLFGVVVGRFGGRFV